MSTEVDAPAPSAYRVPARASRGWQAGRWIDRWEPESATFWNRGGSAIARKNLAFSIFAEHLGFNIWVLWTIIVLNLADIGITLSISQLFWLTAIPNLIGSALRIPYTFALPRFGGRLWTTISAGLLLIPVTLVAVILPSGWLHQQSTSAQFWILLACAATAGVGGGNFSSSMANISFFYPDRKKGFALGLNAAGGNLGVAVTQLLVPLVVIIGVPAAAVKLPIHQVHLAYAGILWMPFIVAAAIGAYYYMDSLTQAKTDTKAYAQAVGNPHTWIMSLLYIGTFGSFIGYSFALPLVIKNTFPEFLAHHVFIATYLAGLGFIGALLGSLARPVGGWTSDRIGGARVTLASFVGMGVFTGTAIAAVDSHSFTWFFVSYMFIFLLSGIGNGSAYRMIPAIFATLGRRQAAEHGRDEQETILSFKRQTAAVIGIAGSIGAFGGFLIQVVFRQASLHVSGLLTKATAAGTKATAPLTKAIATSHDRALVAHDKVLLAHDKAAGLQTKVAIAHANSHWSIGALQVFLVAYVLLAVVTWFFYMRRSTSASLATASI
ncbi:MAG TPA: nitrate/nitrite transporter [Solirubrobacteraceae bacterium]|jgi:NNP family nitrate/nitrite transporter-like MFS transporter|nr:nitrate/nitrite transporter [Solirubrobacteraceae bacterium]